MAADAQVQYAYDQQMASYKNVLAELVSELLAIFDTVIFLLFSSLDGMRRGTPRHQCIFLLDELSSVSQHVLGINSQDIHRTPHGPYAEEKVSSQFDIFNGATKIESKKISFISPRLSMP